MLPDYILKIDDFSSAVSGNPPRNCDDFSLSKSNLSGIQIIFILLVLKCSMNKCVESRYSHHLGDEGLGKMRHRMPLRDEPRASYTIILYHLHGLMFCL